MEANKAKVWFTEFENGVVPELGKDLKESAEKIVLFAMWKKAPHKRKFQKAFVKVCSRVDILVETKKDNG